MSGVRELVFSIQKYFFAYSFRHPKVISNVCFLIFWIHGFAFWQKRKHLINQRLYMARAERGHLKNAVKVRGERAIFFRVFLVIFRKVAFVNDEKFRY